MNVLTFSGNIGRDCEIRATKTGTIITQVAVAMNSGFGEHKKTNWVKCAIFGKRGESLAPYLLKGQQVVVSGELSLNEWTTQDGITKSTLECNVNDITLVGGKPVTAAPKPPAKQAPQQTADFDDFEDSIPF